MMSFIFLRNILLSFFLSVLFWGVAKSSDRKTNIDSLLKVINSTDSHDSVVMRAYFRLSWDLKSIEPLTSLDHARKALEIAERLNNKEKIADALSQIGVIYWQMGNFNMSLDYQLEALGIYSDIDNETGIARSSTNIGIIFFDKGYYDKAVEYFYKALLLYERKENTAGMAAVLNNLGMISEYQKDFDLAEKYHLQSLEIKQQAGDVKGMSFSYNNLGMVYKGKQLYEKSMEYFNLALEIREKLNDKREIANTLSNMGFLYFQMKDHSNAKTYLNRALDLYNEVNDKGGIAKVYNFMGRLYMQTNEEKSAQNYFAMSLKIANEIGLSRMITENYSGMALLMAKMGNFEDAFDYQQLFISMKDSIYNEDSRRKTVELKLMYDREKKESEMELNQQIHFLSSQKNRLLKNFLIAGVVLVLVSLFLLYNRFLIAKNANTLLEDQKNEITLSNEKLISLNQNLLEQKKKSEELNHQLQLSNQKLIESEKHLIEINSTKDKFFSIISHDLRNPFAAIVSFSRILKRDIENLTVQELKDLALELDKSVLKINNLLENLLQWSRTQTGKIRYEPEYIAIHEIVKDNLLLFKNNAKEKKITLVDLVDDNTPVWADRNMTDTVIRNLLSNALKYTDEGGKIIIKSEMKDHNVYISIEDNGVGMSEESKNKIFRIDTLHSTYGTMDEKGSGLGLLLCKEFVEKQGGSITFKSEKDKGSVFIFSLPPEQRFNS
jgi:signal transduction histidine kinase/Tfp pilus assembly protein PilF